MIDPVSMATQLAAWEVHPFEQRANLQLQILAARRSALSSINSEVSSLKSFVSSLNSFNNSVIKNSATSSDEDRLTASATASAQSGSYQIFVEQLAQSHQLASKLPDGSTQDSLVPTNGEITFEMNGESFVIDLATLVDDDGELDYMELMKAINADPENIGISASLVRSGDSVQLLFTSEESGEANEIKITSNTNDAVFDDAMDSTNMQELSKNSDSIAWLGGQGSGIRLQNDSNVLSNVIDGVNITLKKTHEMGDVPLTLVVGSDSEATNESMLEFVEKYNAVIKEIQKHSASGGEDGGRGILSADPITRGIASSMRSVMQQSFDGISLSQIGLTFDRSGELSFDSDTFDEFQSTSTVDIDQIFRGEGMLLDQLEGRLDVYSNSTTGSIKNQLDSIDAQQSRENDKLESLERKYDMYYTRYLKQFSALSNLQMRMQNTSSMF